MAALGQKRPLISLAAQRLLSAEAASKRSNSKVGGNYNQYSDRIETKVGTQSLNAYECIANVVRCPIVIKIGHVLTQPRPKAAAGLLNC